VIWVAAVAALLGLVAISAVGLVLLDPNHLGSRRALIPLTLYCALAEINMTPLAGAKADKLLDVSLALLALSTVAALWWRDRPTLDEVAGQPIGWLLMLFTAGLVFAPFSIDPFVTVLRTTVAVSLVAMAGMLVRHYGYLHTLAAGALGTSSLVAMSLAWEIVGPGTPLQEFDGYVLDSGLAGLARHSGITASPNQFGRVAATTVVAGVLILRAKPYARFGWLFQAIGLAGLFYAQSRTAIIMGISFMLLAHALSGRAVSITTIVMFCAAVALWLSASGVLGVQTVTRKNGGTEELTTATGRTALWAIAWDLAWDEPLIGHGAFATHSVLAPAVQDGRIAFNADDAHDIYLNVFVSQGLFGVSLLSAFVLSSVAAMRRRMPAAAGAGVLLATVGGLGLTETPIWKPNSTLVLLAIAGAGLSVWRSTAVQPAQTKQRPSLKRQASRQMSSSAR
jgi:O-antigen ligase